MKARWFGPATNDGTTISEWEKNTLYFVHTREEEMKTQTTFSVAAARINTIQYNTSGE